MAVGLVYFLFFSSFFDVKKVKISGNEKVSREAIESLVQEQIVNDFRFLKNKNINLISLEEIDKALLENFPQIAKVSSKKDLPNTIEVQIEERKPALIFKQNENYFLSDKEGIIFEIISEADQQFAVIQDSLLNKELKLGDRMGEKETILKIIDLESKFKEELKIPAKELTIVSEDRLNIKTAEGWESYFDLKGDLNWQYVKLKAVLEKKVPSESRGNLEYIDLRFDRVYIFPETYDQ
jgi:cell division protein FtsQ